MNSAKPNHYTEQRFFNVSQFHQFGLPTEGRLPSEKFQYAIFFIEINAQRMKYAHDIKTTRERTYTYLYPHDTDNFVLIVPKRFLSETEYGHIFKSPLVLVWAPVAIIVSIARFIFNKIRETGKNLGDIFLETFGLSLGMSFNATISSAAENLLLWCFCLATMLSGMLLSSSMFQGFALQLDILTINNLEELEMSGLEIQAPLNIQSIEHFFKNIPQKLKLNYTLSFEISEMIANRNTTYAYVIRESKFDILFSNDKDVWHVIERFGDEHLSYILRFYTPLEDTMNTLLQRCVNHGIVKYLKEKNKRLIIGIKPEQERKEKEVISSNWKPLSHFFKNIPQKLKLNYTLSFEISEMIANRNTTYAYVIRESKFDILFSNDKDVWHVIERFGDEHLSYILRFYTPLEDTMNTLLQRCVNHGIVKYLKEKNKRLIIGIKPEQERKEKEVISSNWKPLSLSDMTNSFLLGALGLLCSVITFIAEKIYFANCCCKRIG
ncbi:hypothetical protein Bhyg_08834 [Pseudolycoriella hygida]|uniref:Uncharacterized protein n=1 Tax=Pseudolycoriella hygida TaxID=35572 RepID=A0A9Q0N737_9DIPT|nr:hypothetical protein Bhyg_08834 [Pseudolycoriella hygida]